MAADFKALNRNQQGALIAGGLAFILSLFSSYVRVSVDGGPASGLNVSAGTSAWTSYATLGMLLILAATAVVAIKAFAANVLPDGVPWNLVAAGLAGVGTFLVVIRALTVGGDVSGVSVGPGWSGILLFIAGIALTTFTVMGFRDSGEKMPDLNRDTPSA